MKIFLTDQKNKLKEHLDFLKLSQVMIYNKSRLTEKTNTVELATHKQLSQLDLDFLFDYKIFPDSIMTFKTQWQEESRKMKVGDTIVQQVYIPPTKNFSQKIIFGVRINEIIEQTNKKGFSYETLCGHVEKGISTFTIEQFNNKLVFKIQTYSTPGNILTKLLGPIFSIPYQTYCTKSALQNVKRQIENLKKTYDFKSWEEYWKAYDKLIELLKIDNQNQIILEFNEAQRHVSGLTDGWYEFKFAFEKSLNSNKNKMTIGQMDIADFLVSTLDKYLTNR